MNRKKNYEKNQETEIKMRQRSAHTAQYKAWLFLKMLYAEDSREEKYYKNLLVRN